jgi:hypothetical protein
MLSILSGCAVSLWLLAQKVLHHSDVMAHHGPMMIFGAVCCWLALICWP